MLFARQWPMVGREAGNLNCCPVLEIMTRCVVLAIPNCDYSF